MENNYTKDLGFHLHAERQMTSQALIGWWDLKYSSTLANWGLSERPCSQVFFATTAFSLNYKWSFCRSSCLCLSGGFITVLCVCVCPSIIKVHYTAFVCVIVKDSVSTVLLTLLEKKADFSLKPDTACFVPGFWRWGEPCQDHRFSPFLIFGSDCQLGKKIG